MKELLQLTNDSLKELRIDDCIRNLRGQQVMLDVDIAYFFGVETKRLNEQMKRNIERFPEDFCFKLNSLEFKNLRCQNGIFNASKVGRKYLPYAYTEHGVIALAGVLKSEVAAKMSVEIARTFVQTRKFILENKDLLLSLAKVQNRQIEFENETNKKFDEMLKKINQSDLPKEAIFFSGQFFDAYEFVVDIIVKAKQSIVLIDPYCDLKALKLLKNKREGVSIHIIKGKESKLEQSDVDEFASQYGEITITTIDDIHDRFMIIDDSLCYSLGTSLNYMGKKLFSINKIETERITKAIKDSIL